MAPLRTIVVETQIRDLEWNGSDSTVVLWMVCLHAALGVKLSGSGQLLPRITSGCPNDELVTQSFIMLTIDKPDVMAFHFSEDGRDYYLAIDDNSNPTVEEVDSALFGQLLEARKNGIAPPVEIFYKRPGVSPMQLIGFHSGRAMHIGAKALKRRKGSSLGGKCRGLRHPKLFRNHRAARTELSRGPRMNRKKYNTACAEDLAFYRNSQPVQEGSGTLFQLTTARGAPYRCHPRGFDDDTCKLARNPRLQRDYPLLNATSDHLDNS